MNVQMRGATRTVAEAYTAYAEQRLAGATKQMGVQSRSPMKEVQRYFE